MSDEENYDPEPANETVEEPAGDEPEAKEEVIDESAPLLRDWMIRKKCWCSEFFDVLVEYGYDEPNKIKTIDEEMFDAMKNEVLEEFTNVDRAAVARFEKMWRNRINGPRSPPTSPGGAGEMKRSTSRGRGRGKGRGRKGRSPQPSPRRDQHGAGFSGQSDGGAELKRWMKSKNCFHLELFQFLVARGYTTSEQIADLMSKDVKVLLNEALADYMRNGRSGQSERSRFENNSKKFVKAHRDVHGVDHILSQETLESKATIFDSATDNVASQAPELRRLLQAEEFNVVALLEELVGRGITTPDQLLETPEGDIDEIIRVVKTDQMRALQTKLLRDRMEKKMDKFRVYWVNNNYL